MDTINNALSSIQEMCYVFSRPECVFNVVAQARFSRAAQRDVEEKSESEPSIDNLDKNQKTMRFLIQTV